MAAHVGAKASIEVIGPDGSFTITQCQNFSVSEDHGSQEQREVGNAEAYEIVNQSLSVSGSFTVNQEDVASDAVKELVGDSSVLSPIELLARIFTITNKFTIVEYTSIVVNGNAVLREKTRIENCQISRVDQQTAAASTSTMSFNFMGTKLPIRS
jgi:hypothetical protein